MAAPGDYIPDLMPWLLELEEIAGPFVFDRLKQGLIIAAEQAGDVAPELLVSVDNPAVAEFVRQYTIRLAGSVSRTTIAKLTEELAAGLDAGEGLRLLRDRVRAAMGEQSNRYRAEMIARTESSRAQNAGRTLQNKALGAKRKVWRALPTACEFCKTLDGKTVGIDQVFAARGDNIGVSREDGTEGRMKLDYSDTDYPPLHPNCMCVLEYDWEG
jgi:hypothetical protein